MTYFLTFLGEFTLLCLTAIVMENAIFARGFGLSRAIAVAKRPRSVVGYGALLTLLTLLGSVLCYLVTWLLPNLPWGLMPLVYLAAMTLLYLICLVLNSWVFHNQTITHYLPVATFNCAVLGGIFLAVQAKYAFWQFVAFGLGTGIGFVLSTLLMVNGMRLLRNKQVPKAFAGLPLMLLFVGILSLAFYCLIGHPLPF